MSRSIGTTTHEALGRAREQAGAALSTLGGTVEEVAHEVVERIEKDVPVLAERAADKAKGLLDESGTLLDHAVTAVRKDLARRIEPEPTPVAWWRWVAAGGLVAAVLAGIAYVVLSRRPQELSVNDVAEPPSTIPPTDVVGPGADAARGHR
ncbi:hypothetical protein [Pseudonocardia sp.]|jgi:hypothetical protein|uniref:hypothetical protein n=1 Tax=Pseudonocardia sp. TaxID=60912 RepID=UPI0031FBC2D7